MIRTMFEAVALVAVVAVCLVGGILLRLQ